MGMTEQIATTAVISPTRRMPKLGPAITLRLLVPLQTGFPLPANVKMALGETCSLLTTLR